MRVGAASIAIVLLLAHPAAADRSIEIGTTCEDFRQLENGLGSRLHGSEPQEESGAYQMFLDGTSASFPARVSFVCESNRVVRQSVHVFVPGPEEGGRVLAAWESRLVAVYGPPTLRRTPEGLDRASGPPAGTILNFIDWSSEALSISLMLSGDPVPGSSEATLTWAVSVLAF